MPVSSIGEATIEDILGTPLEHRKTCKKWKKENQDRNRRYRQLWSDTNRRLHTPSVPIAQVELVQ
ncbi:hypothetical protein COB55_00275 [Candidatus Wolfebacteria bacterium]|nr:MAG: hypothetical protein COB55_00275 [Candidatus Wolfebacteria bacterium]